MTSTSKHEEFSPTTGPDRRENIASFSTTATTMINWGKYAVAFLLLLLALRAFLIEPWVRFSLPAQAAYNEGWNAYRQNAVLHNERLYGTPTYHYATNYPPVSFWLVALVARSPAKINKIGRFVSMIAWLAVGLELTLIVVLLVDDVAAGLVAGALFLFVIAAFSPLYVGTNDPEMLGHAIVMAGVLLYLWRGRTSNTALVFCSLLCCFALFIKQNLVAFPMAIAIDLLLLYRKRLALWCIALLIALGGLGAITQYWEGPYFVQNLLAPRSYSLTKAIAYLSVFSLLFQLGLSACLLWAIIVRRHLMLWALEAALIVGIAFSGGGGTYLNMAFDAIIAMCIIWGLMISSLNSRTVADKAAGRSRWAVAMIPLLLLIPSLSLGVLVPDKEAKILRDSTDYQGDVTYMKRKPGVAICENLLLCFDSGKEMKYDPFWVKEFVLIGKVRERDILQSLRNHNFDIIQLDLPEDELLLPKERTRFTEGFIRTLLVNYREDRRNESRVFFVPR